MHIRDHRTCRAEDEPGEGEPPVPLGRVREHEQDGPDDGEDVPCEDEVLPGHVPAERAREADERGGDADGNPKVMERRDFGQHRMKG